MKYFRSFLFFGLFLLTSLYSVAQTPDSFTTHKVKRGETIELLIDQYKITKTQLLEYNPSLEKFGLRKRMNLRIPVYQVKEPIAVTENSNLTAEDSFEFTLHEVVPKETKWRLAYQYKTTIQTLDSLNPEIKEGLKIGQKIRIPLTPSLQVLPEKDSLYNYYTVLPKEGYYRIEKKLGVDQATLDSLNPNLKETGLIVGMILKIPGEQSGDYKIEDDLLVERVNLSDSTFIKGEINLALLLPFKVNEIVFDSIEDTKKLLQTRNLHTLSLDFYTGVLFAVERANELGIKVLINTFDTENKTSTLDQIISELASQKTDFIVGPLIPNNFNYVSNQKILANTPKIAPLSSNPVVLRKNVYQSITQAETFRTKMFDYLNRVIDTTQHVVIVADSLNRSIEKQLKSQFPWAITLRPEKGDYILPELADSLLVDSLPNKVILETQSFPLIANALSQFNAQNSGERKVQVFTTYRSNVYNNENLSRKVLGGIGFTYPVGFKPLDYSTNEMFIESFENRFGKRPNKESLRGYDLVMDLILRTAASDNLEESLKYGETQYWSNRFLYQSGVNGSYMNQALYLLQHRGYEILEIKE
ncbi:MAG: LysM peptidoglycan-binding domain-containing protein [Flavobacteriaceae bacterium]|nr:LysM peptidoglycan-binding domain-containing protein [Flavobacteriaceae bacterium]